MKSRSNSNHELPDSKNIRTDDKNFHDEIIVEECDTLQQHLPLKPRNNSSDYELLNSNNANDEPNKMLHWEQSDESKHLAFGLDDYSKLHDPFTNFLFPNLPTASLLNLSNANKTLRDWTAYEREKREKREASALLLAVAHGNKTEAEYLLKINPNLLRSKNGETMDLSDRPIKNLTPLQVALCNGDVEMCEMMKEYFFHIEKDQSELKSQFDSIFPNGLEAHTHAQQENIFDFYEILQAIISAPNDEVTLALKKAFNNSLVLHKALEKFREAFTEKSHSEPVFNPYHFLMASQTYIDNFDNLDNFDKRNLFCRQVIGFVQRYFSACYLQRFARGIFFIKDYKSPLERSFNFKNGKGVISYKGLLSGLGVDYYIGIVGDAAKRQLVLTDRSTKDHPIVRIYTNIISEKNISLGEIIQLIGARSEQMRCNSLK